ncbi:MAG TPA: hypothetical protein VE974_06065 [Thermoanaerobaculia bacterium]|nr:hypothetical protein [Thermoanaerobaculia bacterium]
MNYGEAAKNAGAAGLSFNDTAALFGATPEEQKAQKDQLAKQFGYADSDAFYADVFQKPSKTTEQFYREAYQAAGLDGILSSVESKRSALNKAMGVVNDNPWYDEAHRRGEAKRLTELANADIENELARYDLSHDQVKELVARHAEDIGYDEKTKTARFNYLESAAKEAALNLSTSRARENLTSYSQGKQSVQKPDTITVGEGSSVYTWNPNTNAFELTVSKPKTYAPTKAKTSTAASSSSSTDKTVAAFRAALASRTNLNRAGTREQFIRELQAKYPNIEPSDVARAVYETYPDGYNSK